MTPRISIMATLLSLMAWACTTQAVGPAPGAPASTTFGRDDAVAAARADAVRRTGAAPESLELVSAESVTWPDGSLGCPEPGRLYTQALVPGYRVRLRGPAGVLDYHASVRGALVLCPAERARDPLPAASRI